MGLKCEWIVSVIGVPYWFICYNYRQQEVSWLIISDTEICTRKEIINISRIKKERP